ncbi:hypothetical protein BSKO_02338 [Bryopsis sp. KO-2023]|nr:hypothetical protein BSKO_02338 [Bryopsis sp. KO-2023]
MWCVTPSWLSPPTLSQKLAAVVFLLSVWHSTAILLDEDIVTTVPTTPFPTNTVRCPGGYWTVAVTTFGVDRGSFGKARSRNGGGVQAYFPFEGKERMDAQSMDLLQLPSVDTRDYRWVDISEYFRKKHVYKPVSKNDKSPFAYYHPGDGGNWQVGKIDLVRNVGSYTVAGEMFEVTPGAVEKGKILVVSFKEDAYAYWKKIILLVVTMMLNIVAFSLLVPFFRRGNRGHSFLSNSPLRAAGASAPQQGVPRQTGSHREINNPINVIEQKPKNKENEKMMEKNEKRKCCAGSSSLKKEKDNTEGVGDVNLNVKLMDSVIGVGGFGAVETGIWEDQKVAVKFVNPMSGHDAVSTILHELDVLQRIPDHANVVKCYGRCMDEKKRVGLVEELMDMSLDDWVHGEGFRARTPLKALLDVFIGIANGLEHLHKCKIVHYDLKPRNVLLDKGLIAKVADFGCSRIKANSYITAGLAGTVPYLAPECVLSVYCNLKGRVRAEKIDVFSFGVVMWEALMGSTPGIPGDNLGFESDFTPASASACTNSKTESISNAAWSSTSTERLNNCLSAKFPISSGCPVELRDLVSSCMSVDNRSRPKCTEVRRNLEKMRSAPWASRTVSQVMG